MRAIGSTPLPKPPRRCSCRANVHVPGHPEHGLVLRSGASRRIQWNGSRARSGGDTRPPARRRSGQVNDRPEQSSSSSSSSLLLDNCHFGVLCSKKPPDRPTNHTYQPASHYDAGRTSEPRGAGVVIVAAMIDRTPIPPSPPPSRPTWWVVVGRMIDRAPFLLLLLILSQPPWVGRDHGSTTNVAGHAIIIYCSKHPHGLLYLFHTTHDLFYLLTCSLARYNVLFGSTRPLFVVNHHAAAVLGEGNQQVRTMATAVRRRTALPSSVERPEDNGGAALEVYDDPRRSNEQDARGNGGGHQPSRAMVLMANNGHVPPPPPPPSAIRQMGRPT
jgi:hypothetical protein